MQEEEEDEVLEETEFERAEEDEVLEEAEFERTNENDDRADVAEAVHAINEIAGYYKKQYKSASKGDKVKILLIIIPLVILFFMAAAGIFLANLGEATGVYNIQLVGFILMGVGIGGMFLTVGLILIISKIRNK